MRLRVSKANPRLASLSVSLSLSHTHNHTHLDAHLPLVRLSDDFPHRRANGALEVLAPVVVAQNETRRYAVRDLSRKQQWQNKKYVGGDGGGGGVEQPYAHRSNNQKEKKK